mgnify:CR=1|jgi:hypothetical protein
MEEYTQIFLYWRYQNNSEGKYDEIIPKTIHNKEVNDKMKLGWKLFSIVECKWGIKYHFTRDSISIKQ